jgi:hypothetical protein
MRTKETTAESVDTVELHSQELHEAVASIHVASHTFRTAPPGAGITPSPVKEGYSSGSFEGLRFVAVFHGLAFQWLRAKPCVGSLSLRNAQGFE